MVEEPVHEQAHRAPAQPGAARAARQPEPDLGAPLPGLDVMDDDDPQEGVRAGVGHRELEPRALVLVEAVAKPVLVGVLLESDPGAEVRILGEGAREVRRVVGAQGPEHHAVAGEPHGRREAH